MDFEKIFSSIDRVVSIFIVLGVLGFGFFAGVRSLSASNPQWVAAMQAATTQQRRRNILFSVVFGVTLLVFATLTFTYEQATADLLTHLMGVVLGMLGFMLFTSAIAETPKLRAWQLEHVDVVSRIRLGILLLFFSLLAPVLIYAVIS